jgi:5'-3' exonuclease
MTQALIDGDLVAFRCAASCESWVLNEQGEKEKAVLPVETAYVRANELMENIIREVGTEDYHTFLTDSAGNFRKTVSADYKANRKDTVRPIHLKALEDFLIQSWGAERAVGCEADDLLGVCQTTNSGLGIDSVIVTIDKDLDTIPGKHYKFVRYVGKKGEFASYAEGAYDVSEEDALYFFYQQLMQGDPTDNITGCPGIGPKKAEKALEPVRGDEALMYQVVFEQYEKSYPELCSNEIEELITTVGRLVYIRHAPEEMWTPPKS